MALQWLASVRRHATGERLRGPDPPQRRVGRPLATDRLNRYAWLRRGGS
jgi:hypothetical protein